MYTQDGEILLEKYLAIKLSITIQEHKLKILNVYLTSAKTQWRLNELYL